MSGALMAERKKPGPKPDPSRVRSELTNIRSTPEWKAWLLKFAEFMGTDVSDLIDDSLLRRAREAGFKMPPRR